MSFNNGKIKIRECKTESNNCLNQLTKKNNMKYYRDTLKQFCPFQRVVDYRPYPFRNFVRASANYNYYNNPTEKDSFFSCFVNYPKKEIQPLITRQDLKKYFKVGGKILKHYKPCSACNRIRDGNYGRNYYTMYHKSFPFINGNFTGTNFRIKTGKPSVKSRNDMRSSLNINDFGYTNSEKPNIKSVNRNEFNEKVNNSCKKSKTNNSTDIFRNYTLSEKRQFHKTQIFNRYKPFLVDDFNDYERRINNIKKSQVVN